jgi:hypothetical protein
MSFDTYSFFLVGLSGFMTVWTFRYFTGSKKTAEFEYVGLSAFWGLVMLVIWESLPKAHPEQITELLSNPYAAGFVLSLLGALVGYAGSEAVKLIKWIKERRLLRHSQKKR